MLEDRLMATNFLTSSSMSGCLDDCLLIMCATAWLSVIKLILWLARWCRKKSRQSTIGKNSRNAMLSPPQAGGYSTCNHWVPYIKAPAWGEAWDQRLMMSEDNQAGGRNNDFARVIIKEVEPDLGILFHGSGHRYFVEWFCDQHRSIYKSSNKWTGTGNDRRRPVKASHYLMEELFQSDQFVCIWCPFGQGKICRKVSGAKLYA